MVISRVEEKLRRLPHVEFSRGPGFLEVPARTRAEFAVSIRENDVSYVVAYEGWHEHFSDADEAARYFGFGLSSACRLRVIRRGSMDYRWIVQYQEDGHWIDESETGLFFFPFWSKREERFLQNRILGFDARSVADATRD